METIKNYLDNMFAGLPKTARIAELKNNILSNMEDKYNELKSQGKSENEAIGIVISEFGNIDELVSELGIRKNDEANSQPVVTEEEVNNYLKAKKSMGIQVSLGVFLCISAPAILMLLYNLLNNNVIPNHLSEDAIGVISIIPLFLLITVAVGIFIFSGMHFERYRFMEKGVQIPNSLELKLKQVYDKYISTFYLKIILGVGIIILSPIILFVSYLISEEASTYAVVVLLFIIASAVPLFINSGVVKESYESLLKIGDYSVHTEKEKKENRIIGAVASIVWPLSAIIFLFCGFVYDLWNIAWIVFPITGILFGMFSAAFNILTGRNES